MNALRLVLAPATALGLALGIGLALPAGATDVAAMTDAERQAFGAEVRSYLLQNPEVLMEVIAELDQRQAAAKSQDDRALVAANATDLFASPADWVGGNPSGDITIVEFTDYRCGYCRKAFPEVEQLVATDGNIRLVLKEFPILGDQSTASSRTAIATRLALGDDAYKAMHDALITYRGDIDEAATREIAADLGLDAEAILARLNSDEVEQIIAENHLLAQRLQISGTPTFVIGDEMLRGYMPLDGMQQLIAAQRNGG